MTTECNQEPFPFHPLNQREVRGQFDGGSITSDAGGLLLREVEKRTNIIGQFASCFTDYRDPELKEHAVAELVAQRIYGLALGYEDLNDHEELRRDPLLGVLVEKEDLTGKDRRRVRDQGTALAGKSTLNRMELGAAKLGKKERYKKIIDKKHEINHHKKLNRGKIWLPSPKHELLGQESWSTNQEADGTKEPGVNVHQCFKSLLKEMSHRIVVLGALLLTTMRAESLNV